MRQIQNTLVNLPDELVEGKFLRRVKRFSIEAQLRDGIVWAHCNNTGTMSGLQKRGAPVLLSRSAKPGRKLPYTLERVWAGCWVGVNTLVPNRFLEAAFKNDLLDFAQGYESLKREVKSGQSRLDACLYGTDKAPLWIECKNVTLVEDEIAWFPDAKSERALKHLQDLMALKASGHRAAMFFLVQRKDAKCFAPADFIDPNYANGFWKAIKAGVEAYAYRPVLTPNGYAPGEFLPLARFSGL